jgi:hypothetical protein
LKFAGKKLECKKVKTMPKKSNSKTKSSLAIIPPVLTGVAGEYFVAAELSRRGYIASISLRNTRGIDILATNQVASHSITIQCKTSRIYRKIWMLNDKSEQFFAPNHYYVFVGLGAAGQRPIFHVVPSTVVAKFTSESHQKWLRMPGKAGRQHIDSAMRNFKDPNDEYLDRWDLLGL